MFLQNEKGIPYWDSSKIVSKLGYCPVESHMFKDISLFAMNFSEIQLALSDLENIFGCLRGEA